MVSGELLEELRMISKEELNLELSNSELSEFGNGLCNYFEQLSKLACENKYENEKCTKGCIK